MSVKSIKGCKNCLNDFVSWDCQNKKFCSRKCYWEYMIGKPGNKKGKKVPSLIGNKHSYIQDRSKIVGRHVRSYDLENKKWSRQVKNRDGWECQIANGDCSGRVEAHHILSWRDYEELRYELRNGITLCYFHHPRKRSEEERLQSSFQELIAAKMSDFE